jgi:hypothetical protein
MPKYDLIAKEINWCESNRNPAQKVYQDGFIAGLYHALFLMKSRPTPRSLEGIRFAHHCTHGYNGLCPVCDALQTPPKP